MRARVIVTKKCNRKCKGCCNERLGLIDKVSFENLFKYEEICITGGEPMLMSERVVEMIHRLRLQGYTGKIWLYTASSRKLKSYWACKMLIDAVDGITYTIHHGKMETVKRDLTDLRHLDTYLKESDRSGKGYFERAISVRADSPIFFCLNFRRFLVITQIISNMGLHSIKKMYNKYEIL